MISNGFGIRVMPEVKLSGSGFCSVCSIFNLCKNRTKNIFLSLIICMDVGGGECVEDEEEEDGVQGVVGVVARA